MGIGFGLYSNQFPVSVLLGAIKSEAIDAYLSPGQSSEHGPPVVGFSLMEAEIQIDRSKINFMPLIRGPLWDQKDLPRHVYASVESLVLNYETDPDAIPPLLPEPFKPGKLPIGFFKPLIDALKSLPVHKVTQTVHWHGSMVLCNDKNGRIR